jgi:hypothetical protein
MYVVMGVVVYVMFKALRLPVLLLGALLGAFFCGNLTILAIDAVRGVYARREFPYNWLAFIGVLG